MLRDIAFSSCVSFSIISSTAPHSQFLLCRDSRGDPDVGRLKRSWDIGKGILMNVRKPIEKSMELRESNAFEVLAVSCGLLLSLALGHLYNLVRCSRKHFERV